MFRRYSILRGLGVLLVFILVVFTGVFFYAYITGGDSKALSMFSGDGVAVKVHLDDVAAGRPGRAISLNPRAGAAAGGRLRYAGNYFSETIAGDFLLRVLRLGGSSAAKRPRAWADDGLP